MKNINKIEKALEELFGTSYKHDSKENGTFHPSEKRGHQDCQVFTEAEYKFENGFPEIDRKMIDELHINGATYYSIYQG